MIWLYWDYRQRHLANRNEMRVPGSTTATNVAVSVFYWRTTSNKNVISSFISSLPARYVEQESSAKLTNQRVSYAFTSSPFSFHARHVLPTSKFQHSYSCNLLIFYRHR